MKKLLLLALLCTALLIGCETNITVNLPKHQEKLIVEGYINSGLPAMVILSRNMGYFEPIDSAALNNVFITDTAALVVVSDGSTTDTLLPTPITTFPFQAYVGRTLLGEIGKNYQLTIAYQGKHYYATTTIPEAITIDSVWFEPSEQNDSLGQIGLSFTDNPTQTNYYHASLLTVGEQWWYHQPYGSLPVFSDDLRNGDTIEVLLNKGDPYTDLFRPTVETPEGRDSLRYHQLNSIVSVKIGSMDADFFRWWNSYYRSLLTGSNPYSNPASVVTNIEGDASAGVWGGYGNTFTHLYITDSATVREATIEDLLAIDLDISTLDSLLTLLQP